MNKKRLHMLVLVLGLAMVWLGFLYTYELKIADKSGVEARTTEVRSDTEGLQIASSPASSSTEARGLEAGFPILLVGLGIVFLAGGASRFRQQKMYKVG